MNYEEMMSAQDNSLLKTALLPVGFFHKKNMGGKYENVVDLKNHLSDNVKFGSCVKAECEQNKSLRNKHQLHFTLSENGKFLEVERGNFVTFTHLLNDNPALVGRSAFLKSTLKGLFDIAEYLHEQGVYHLCFSPDNVFVRKGEENTLMLLSHGSFYSDLPDKNGFYGEMADYVAPEVIAGGAGDERSDVYSIGKFIEWLYTMASMPIEYKRILAKATSENPDDRYHSVDDMKGAMDKLTAMKRSAITFAATATIAFLIVGIYFVAVPEPDQVEYVTPAPKQDIEDLLDEGFDPTTELGIITNDSLELTPQQQKELKEYEEKAEQIFRKRYAEAAEKILSRIYNNKYMGSNEKQFMAGSKSITDELIKEQVKIATEADVSDTKSQKIASEIIEKITEEKKKTLVQHGIQK